jgi:TATA-binding protein-associated factor Taf7
VLVDLPCHAETHKTLDGVHMFKSGDVSQMLIAYRAQDGPPVELQELLASDSSHVGLRWPHGVCPAAVMHRIRQKRFLNENDLKYEDIADGEKAILDCLAEKEVTILEQDIVTMADYRRHLRDWQENPLETNPIWKKSEEIGAGDRGARSPSASGSGVDLQDDDGSAVSGPAGVSSAPPSGVGAQSRAKSSKQAVDHFKAMMEMDDSDDESIPASGAESSVLDNSDAGETSAQPTKPSNIWEWRSY